MSFEDMPIEIQVICRQGANALGKTPEQVHQMLQEAYSPPEMLVGHKQIGNFLGLSRTTLHRRLKSGNLSAFIRKNDDGEWVARKEDLLEYRDANH